MKSIVPYVGGKTKIARWIIGNMPEHTTYVEPFGGSASVLINKPRSHREIYNDADGDVVNFFRQVRERPDELAEFARDIPFAEEIHNRWGDQWFDGERPDDEIRRAAVWMYLRYSSFNGKAGSKSGFKREPTTSERTGQEADPWRQAPERIRETAERFRGVSIVNADFSDVIERYDTEGTLFYLDPPYYGTEHYYPETADHDAIARALSGIDGDAMVSYTDVPPECYTDWQEIARDVKHNAGNDTKRARERLLCNFRPEIRERFTDANQTSLDDIDEYTGGTL